MLRPKLAQSLLESSDNPKLKKQVRLRGSIATRGVGAVGAVSVWAGCRCSISQGQRHVAYFQAPHNASLSKASGDIWQNFLVGEAVGNKVIEKLSGVFEG